MTSRVSPRLTRRGAVIGVAVAVCLAIGGCGAANPRYAQPNYGASDGVSMSMAGQVTGENLMIVAAGKRQPGALVGALTNRGDATVSVTIGLPGASQPIAHQSLGPRETLLLGAPNGVDIQFPSVPAAPGALQQVTFAADALGAEQVPIPVLDGTFPEYASLIPTSTPAAA